MQRARAGITVGPGGIVYLAITGLILAAAIYTQANLLFAAFGLMVGGLVVSVLLAVRMLTGLRVQRLLPAHAVADDLLAVRYRIEHRGWLPVFGLVISERWEGKPGRKRSGGARQGPNPLKETPARLGGRPFGWVLHLGPNQTIQAEAPCWPRRRGMLHFERIVVSSSFPFGVVRKVVVFEQSGSVLVFPRLYRVHRRLLHQLTRIDPIGSKQLQKAGGHEEFYGLREHRRGDSYRLIDWKRSARLSKLVTREMTQAAPPRVLLALDLREPAGLRRGLAESAGRRTGLGRMWEGLAAWTMGGGTGRSGNGATRHSQAQAQTQVERAVSLTASLICDAYFQGCQVGLVLWGVSGPTFPMHHSLPHRNRMLEALATLELHPSPPERDLLGIEPSVIVRPEAGEGLSEPMTQGRSMVLSTAKLEEYVSDPVGGTEEILLRRPLSVSRRQERTLVTP
jgi:uncharacterized protein (DUF58 family)